MKLFGGILLVAGTCIGAGMLGLPVQTAAGGFYHTSFFFLVCWLVMTCSAFLMLEVSLWHKEDTNLISMMHETLGKKAEWLTWITYLLFLYSLIASYTSGGGALATQIFKAYGLPSWAGSSLYIGLLGFVVYLGAKWVDRANRLLMIALILAYVGLVSLGTKEVDFELLQGGQADYLFSALPLMVTSFGFHLLIPTLKTYFNNDVKKLRLTLLMGSLLPLIIYLLWEFIILGVVPKGGPEGLIAMIQSDKPVVALTEQFASEVHSSYVGILVKTFAFFAIVSSFLGVSLGLFDFLADGLKIRKTHKGRILLALLTFVPPVVFVILYPKGFLFALNQAGVFAALLLIIFPALMAYVGRYHRSIERSYQVVGGRALPIAAMLFGFIVILSQLGAAFDWLPKPLG